MKKVATLLVFVLSIQVATPSFAQMSAQVQTKALQDCMEELVSKALAPENLKNVNFGERKFLDRLAAEKALFVWSLGDDFDAHALHRVTTGKFFLKFGTIIGSIAGASISILKTPKGVCKNGWCQESINAKAGWFKSEMIPRSTFLRRQIIFGALSILLSMIAGYSIRDLLLYQLRESAKTLSDSMKEILDATSGHEFYQRIADDESENAYVMRSLAILGCNQIRDKIQHYIENPDLFIADMNEMKKNYSSPVLQDSGFIDGVKTPMIHFPSGEKGLFINPKDSVGK